MIIKIDDTVAVRRKDIMSAEITLDTSVKLIFTYGGHVKTSLTLEEIVKLLDLTPINKTQAINKDVISSVVLDASFKVRVFADGGGFLYSDFDFKDTVDLMNGFPLKPRENVA